MYLNKGCLDNVALVMKTKDVLSNTQKDKPYWFHIKLSSPNRYCTTVDDLDGCLSV